MDGSDQGIRIWSRVPVENAESMFEGLQTINLRFSRVPHWSPEKGCTRTDFFAVRYISTRSVGYLITMTTHDSPPSHDKQERRLLVLYATETGNAQDVADRVARTARNLQFRSRVLSVDCYSLVGNFSS